MCLLHHVIMQNMFFDDELLKYPRTFLCPSCKTELKIPVGEAEIVCDECKEEFSIEVNETKDEFVWHPSQNY